MISELPDALVLGAGGTLGEAWMRGVLGGIEAGSDLDFRYCEYMLGTSAGSIVAATLAGGRRPDAGEAAAREWARAMPEKLEAPHAPRRVGKAVTKATRAVVTPLAPAALATTTRAGRFARAAALRAAPRPERTLGGLGRHLDELGTTFDGRLRIAAVDRANGRRVIFGEPDTPKATVTEAVLASCSVPWMFAPVEIGGREYVDGGVWSLTNLDAAPAGRGARVLALIPTAGVSLAPLRAASAAGTAYESAVLRARGVELETIVPDAASLAALGRDLMDEQRRSAAAAAGYAQGRQLV